MRIPSERLRSYEAQLAQLREQARRYVWASFRAAEASGLLTDDDEAMQVAHDALAEARIAYGDQAARAAADLYDLTAEELGHDVPLAEMDNDFSDGEIWAQVGAARKASATAEDFMRHVANFAYDKTYDAARKTTARNADRDHQRGMRYARVPTGRETCGWCVMLASRGFAYTSRKRAGDSGGTFNWFHDRCDCRVISGDEASTVDGYDPDWYLRVYEDARETCGSGDARDIANEINMRSREWVYRKQNAPIDYRKPREAMEDHERWGIDVLSSHGFSIRTIPEDPRAVANLDIRMNGRLWEMKNVTNDGSSLKNQMGRAKKKFYNLGRGGKAMVVLTTYGYEGNVESLLDKVRERGGYEQVLVVTQDGVYRIRK